MRRQHGQAVLFLAVAVVLLAFVGLLAVCTPGEDDHSLGRIQLVSHEDCDDWNGDCGDYSSGGDYGHNRRDDRNRNRGAFSPGPFDRSPVDFSNSCISLDCSGREKKDDRRDRDGMRPASLFPPSPDAIRQFILATIKSGIEMGRLFADTTITFVSNLLVGIA